MASEAGNIAPKKKAAKPKTSSSVVAASHMEVMACHFQVERRCSAPADHPLWSWLQAESGESSVINEAHHAARVGVARAASAASGSGVGEAASQKLLGFSKGDTKDTKVKEGAFLQEHPGADLPVLHSTPRGQQASGIMNPTFAYKGAWRGFIELVLPSLYLIGITGMQFDFEAGVQSLLVVMFAACVSYLGLGDGVMLKRENVLAGSTRKGPIEFLFFHKTILTFVVEAKLDLSSGYAAHVEQLYREMYAAWENNQKHDKGGDLPVMGVLLDSLGAIMFRLSVLDGALVSVACSKYMYIFQGAAPGCDLPLFLLHVLASVHRECCDWDEGKWKARADDVRAQQLKHDECAKAVMEAYAQAL
jgi:hypothetical protein